MIRKEDSFVIVDTDPDEHHLGSQEPVEGDPCSNNYHCVAIRQRQEETCRLSTQAIGCAQLLVFRTKLLIFVYSVDRG